MREPGNNLFLKQRNRAIILNHIRKDGQLSRIDLARKTRLSPTAIGLITSRLIQEDYLRETGTAKSTGGRKPQLLEIKKNSYFSIGFDIEVDSVKMLLLDISGNVIEKKTISLAPAGSVPGTIALMKNLVGKTLQHHSIRKDRFLGVGISIPGLLDRQRQVIVEAPNILWKNVAFGSFDTVTETGDVFLENEANASAVCEHWLGVCKNKNHFICVNISSGIGAGIFLDGNIYHGATGVAGEFGHLIISEDGPLCNCGNHGCLEALVSPRALVKYAKHRLDNSRLPAGFQTDSLDFDQLTNLARQNNHQASDILIHSARYLGRGIAWLVNMFNPETIVIGKKFHLYSALVFDCVKEAVYRHTLQPHRKGLEILLSLSEDTTSALGAAILPQKKTFFPEASSQKYQ